MKVVLNQVQNAGGFNTNDGGFMHKYEYFFNDGTSGIGFHPDNPPPFKAGDEVLVEEKGADRDGVRKVRVKKSESAQHNAQNSTQNNSVRDVSTQEQIMRQTCLKASAEFYAQKGQVSENDVVYTAMRWFEWAKTGNFTPNTEKK